MQLLGSSKYYKLSAVFSDTKEIRTIYYIDNIVLKTDHVCMEGGMLNLEDPIVSAYLQLCNASNTQFMRCGDFIPGFQAEAIVYFNAVDRIIVTGMDGSEFILFEKAV